MYEISKTPLAASSGGASDQEAGKEFYFVMPSFERKTSICRNGQ